MFKIRKKDWIEIVLHIAFWVGVFYTMLSLTQPFIKMRIDHNGKILAEDISHPLSAHIFLTLGFMLMLFYSDVFWLLKKALRYKHIFIRVILPIAWFGIIFVADCYVDALLPAQKKYDTMLMAPQSNGDRKITDKQTDTIKSPVAHPNDVKVIMRQVDNSKPRGHVSTDDVQREVLRQQSRAFLFEADGFSDTLLFIFIIIFGLSVAWFFLKEWSKVEKMRSELAAVQLDTEVKFLKSQVNPHFLFNTLNNLFSMAQKKGNDSLADGISKLSGMMRYMLYDSNAESVLLSTEVTYLEECITLNKLRYADDEVTVTFHHPAQANGVHIAPMLFIPFVENAFKHGVAIGQTTAINIGIEISAQMLTFTCQNANHNAIKKMATEKSGIGLENVKRRLELLYPGKHRLQITETEDKYSVNLQINLA